jgi:hypothetical protein
MRVLRTTTEEILAVAGRWKEQYESGGRWGVIRLGDTKAIYDRLCRLTAHSTKADVAAIIGHDGWTGYTCNECGERVDTAIELGQEADYESSTATVCLPCFNRVAEVVRSLGEASGSRASAD